MHEKSLFHSLGFIRSVEPRTKLVWNSPIFHKFHDIRNHLHIIFLHQDGVTDRLMWCVCVCVGCVPTLSVAIHTSCLVQQRTMTYFFSLRKNYSRHQNYHRTAAVDTVFCCCCMQLLCQYDARMTLSRQKRQSNTCMHNQDTISWTCVIR